MLWVQDKYIIWGYFQRKNSELCENLQPQCLRISTIHHSGYYGSLRLSTQTYIQGLSIAFSEISPQRNPGRGNVLTTCSPSRISISQKRQIVVTFGFFNYEFNPRLARQTLHVRRFIRIWKSHFIECVSVKVNNQRWFSASNGTSELVMYHT